MIFHFYFCPIISLLNLSSSFRGFFGTHCKKRKRKVAYFGYIYSLEPQDTLPFTRNDAFMKRVFTEETLVLVLVLATANVPAEIVLIVSPVVF